MTKLSEQTSVAALNAQAKAAERDARRAATGALDTPSPASTEPEQDHDEAAADAADARADLEARLDEGLLESFPGSDPVAVTQPQRSLSRGGGDR